MLLGLDNSHSRCLAIEELTHSSINRMFGGIETKLNEIEKAFRNEAAKIRDTSKLKSEPFSIKRSKSFSTFNQTIST